MKISLRKVVATAAIAGALFFGTPAAAHANTYNNSSSGSDYITSSTTLNYTAAHGSFNLRVWVTTSGWFVSNKYSIKMYNSSGSLLWSASNQGDRTYYIGGNVTKIVVQRVSAQGATTHWQRS